MEKVKYVVEDSTIAKLLGIQNFTNKESAILELVKNAYDAQAKNVSITFTDNSIVIIDDGIGMNKSTIYDNWMHIGKSSKGYSITDAVNNKQRILAGSKGIGRFALARLGARVVVRSAKSGETPIRWTTDWSESFLDDLTNTESLLTGTEIKISNLRDRWSEKAIKNLINYLSITCNDNEMSIQIYPNYDKKVAYVFQKPLIGKNFLTEIELFYNASLMNLHYKIKSDEFTDIAKQYCPDFDLHFFSNSINMKDEFLGNSEIDFSDSELQKMLQCLGNFSAKLYFSLKASTQQDQERFCYKYKSLEEQYDYGIVLYRNAFSISSYEGKKDWLGLSQRSRKSPAAATHSTGAWRVRANQISGKIEIDKEANSNLRDMANRQGMEENEYYKLFVMIITTGIAAFERYRQSIIRSIDKKNKQEPILTTPIIDKILMNPSAAISLSPNDVKTLSQEIYAIKDETKSIRFEKESTEKKYQYDVRILNVLATTGLKASSMAHELNNDRNSISVNYEYIVNALKEYGFWEELCSQKNTKYSYNNVPQLLKRNKNINQKIISFIDTMLNEIEKNKFLPQNLSVNNIIETIKTNWLRDYSSLSINLDIGESIFFKTSEDVFITIFDNLILNSWQQNKTSAQIEIKISVRKSNSLLKITYSDSGVGLPPKYINDPMRILEVHETSRENGHGLGMWIVNNTIRMTGGNVISVNGHNGFSFSFELGDKL